MQKDGKEACKGENGGRRHAECRPFGRLLYDGAALLFDGGKRTKPQIRAGKMWEMCIIQLAKVDLPMHEDATADVKAVLDETVGLWEVLEQIFVFDIVDLDDVVRVRAEQVPVERQAKHGDDMGDVRLGESLAAAQGEEAARGSVSSPPGQALGAGYVPANVEVQVAGHLVEQRHDGFAEGRVVLPRVAGGQARRARLTKLKPRRARAGGGLEAGERCYAGGRAGDL